jgi:poly(3-hydroxybutyrate) depolymerase
LAAVEKGGITQGLGFRFGSCHDSEVGRENSCNSTPQRVLETSGAYCDSYAQCRGNVTVKLCVTESGGHSWPGGTKTRGDEPPSQAISTNDVMWEFFTSTWISNMPTDSRQ